MFSHSYGIQVAKLAGLPDKVIKRAKEILSNLEANEFTGDHVPKLALSENEDADQAPAQLDIFEKQEKELTSAIHKINVDDMTPLEALIKLNELKNMVNGH